MQKESIDLQRLGIGSESRLQTVLFYTDADEIQNKGRGSQQRNVTALSKTGLKFIQGWITGIAVSDCDQTYDIY